MNNRTKLKLALQATSDIHHKTEDLRGIMEKMSSRQRLMFKDLIKGNHIIRVLIKHNMMKELEKRIPTVRRIDDKIIPVSQLKWSDYDDLYVADKTRLAGHATDMIGRDYKKFIVDIKWMFKMLSVDALKTVVGIMEDPRVSAQTRLSAAQDIMNRAGYEGEKEPQEQKFPVSVVIRYDKKAESDNPATEIVDGETL
jgi:hypothetical protein